MSACVKGEWVNEWLVSVWVSEGVIEWKCSGVNE